MAHEFEAMTVLKYCVTNGPECRYHARNNMAQARFWPHTMILIRGRKAATSYGRPQVLARVD